MIKKEFLMALSLSALLLGGCVDSSTGASARADMEGGEATKTEAKAEAPKAEEKKAQAPVAQKAEAPKAEEKKAEEKKAEAPKEKTASASAEVNTAVCAGCHGANFEKKAMGVSKVVNTLTKDEIKKALHGYKDGTYGGSMKTIMKGQAGGLSDAQIEAIANKVGK
jgi:cytochrome c-type protein NapB